jgi:hypothetical protein
MLRTFALTSCLFALVACSQDPADVPTDELTGAIASCPQPSPPGPHFCPDGTIVVVKDEHGCPYWTCDRGDDPTAAAPALAPPTCPILVAPGEHYCQDGTIVVVKDERGCPTYDCRR